MCESYRQNVQEVTLRLKVLLSKVIPAKQVNVEEDILPVIKVEVMSLDHDFPHSVRRGAQHNDWNQI